MKALFIRLDKIGDLICTLPADELLEFKNIKVHWMISRGLDFIPRNSEPVRSFSTWPRKIQLFQFISFLKFLRQEKFDLAISFQAPWWVSLGLWLTRVPLRSGVKSQWHSYLFLNRGLRQKRSLAVQHESEYNFELARYAASHLIKNAEATLNKPILRLNSPGLWKKPEFLQDYFVIHPGMAGSAKNWPQKNYVSCIESLFTQTNLVCVLTGTAADEAYLSEIKTHFHNHPRFFNFQNQISSEELLDVLNQSHFVLAPSTGVVHMAASLGKQTFGIYSPLRVQHPRRWGARGERVQIFMPPENMAIDDQMMTFITPAEVSRAILSKLSSGKDMSL